MKPLLTENLHEEHKNREPRISRDGTYVNEILRKA